MTLTRSKSACLFAPSSRVRTTRGGTTCCVPGCFNNSVQDNINFYTFPNNQRRKILWLERMGRPQWIPAPQHMICGNHFVGGYLKAPDGKKQDPTVFPQRRIKPGKQDGASADADTAGAVKPARDKTKPLVASHPAPQQRRVNAAAKTVMSPKQPRSTAKGSTGTMSTGTWPQTRSSFGLSTSKDVFRASRAAYETLRDMQYGSRHDGMIKSRNACAEDHCYTTAPANPMPPTTYITIDGERRPCHKIATLSEPDARRFCANFRTRCSSHSRAMHIVNAGSVNLQLPPYMCHYVPSHAFLSAAGKAASIPLRGRDSDIVMLTAAPAALAGRTATSAKDSRSPATGGDANAPPPTTPAAAAGSSQSSGASPATVACPPLLDASYDMPPPLVKTSLLSSGAGGGVDAPTPAEIGSPTGATTAPAADMDESKKQSGNSCASGRPIMPVGNTDTPMDSRATATAENTDTPMDIADDAPLTASAAVGHAVNDPNVDPAQLRLEAPQSIDVFSGPELTDDESPAELVPRLCIEPLDSPPRAGPDAAAGDESAMETGNAVSAVPVNDASLGEDNQADGGGVATSQPDDSVSTGADLSDFIQLVFAD